MDYTLVTILNEASNNRMLQMSLSLALTSSIENPF